MARASRNKGAKLPRQTKDSKSARGSSLVNQAMTEKKKPKKRGKGIYNQIITEVFFRHYDTKSDNKPSRFIVERPELVAVAEKIGLAVAELDEAEDAFTKNIGDVVYSYRFRKQFPKEIRDTAPSGKMWIILGKGDARYEFRLITTPSLMPDYGLYTTKVHDATPEIVRRFTQLQDEQAILARIRYNRLIDLFEKCVAYSLQSHLRTKVDGLGQIEIDELYVGSNRKGEHFIIPVQVKRKKDKLGVSQLLQDLEYCKTVHEHLTAKPIAATMTKEVIDGIEYDLMTLMEFESQETEDDIIIKKRAERHFLLLPWKKIDDSDFKVAAQRPDEE